MQARREHLNVVPPAESVDSPVTPDRFDYDKAFSRNLGWVTETEQAILSEKRVAIAGMGGVGGSHLLTLTRLGIGGFTIADFDNFEIHNFNRQVGANTHSVNRSKVDVMSEMALGINPELNLDVLNEAVARENIDRFLDGADIYVDSLDFFALEARAMVFAACAERGIPAVTAAPLGMGAALLVFLPGKMTFEEYFRLKGHSEQEQALRFMLGLAPSRLQMPYLVDDSRVDFHAKRGPSTPMACELCAGFAGTQVLKILLHRGGVVAAPRGVHFDAYRNKMTTTWRPLGNNNPLQRLGLSIARKRVMAKAEAPRAEVVLQTPIERVLDLAKWAPSGDNEQPWKFEMVDATYAIIHTSDTRDWCVYDLDGSSSQIAVGALLENIELAASAEGMRVEFRTEAVAGSHNLKIHAQLSAESSVKTHPLVPYIKGRVTQRRPLSTQALSSATKKALEEAVGEGYSVIWVEGWRNRARMAKLLFHNAHIRLTTPEAYVTHAKNIEWGARFSEDRIPEQAVGVDLLTGKVMQWALKSWSRVKVLNRFFAGTWLPRLQMDVNAGLRCGAHFVIVADEPLDSAEDYIAGGRAMQRFWLESTRQGLQFQPEMTPIIFSKYVSESREFTMRQQETDLAKQLAVCLDKLLGSAQESRMRVYMGRVGYGDPPASRSTRHPLAHYTTDGA